MTFLHRSNTKPTVKRIRDFLKRNGMTEKGYRNWWDGLERSMGILDFFKRNPTWNLRQWEELLIENVEDITGAPQDRDENRDTPLSGG